MKTIEKHPQPSRRQLALADIVDALKNWRIWFLLSWQDIKMRYRRSTLGPFWITLSMAITIYSMGLLYGRLFNMALTDYYPLLATGMLTWSLISSLLTEGTGIFIEGESFLKQMKLPYTTFILRAVTRNFIIFFHNIWVLIPIIIFLHLKFNFNTLFIFVSLFFIWLNGLSYGLILAILGTRFRDLTQLVNSFVQVIFFLTPVMWSATNLSRRFHLFIDINPFAQFIELLRAPMLGTLPSLYAFIYVLIITLLGMVFAFMLLTKFRARIIYWL